MNRSSTHEIDWTIYWRQRQKKPDPAGHCEPVQPPENTRLAVLDMTGEASWTITETENTYVPPEQIGLLVYVAPISVLPNTTSIQYTYHHTPYKTVSLYGNEALMMDQKLLGMQSRNKAHQIIYAGSGTVTQEGRTHPFQGSSCGVWTCLIPPRGLLFNQQYDFVPDGVMTHHQEPIDQSTALYTPPGIKNCVVLYPYGGRYDAHGTLEDAVQMYFQPTFINNETRIKLFSLPFLKQQGLNPPHDGMWGHQPVVFLRASDQMPQRSLNEEIMQGHISLSCGLGANDPIPRLYQSLRYQYMDRATHLIEIIFVPV